MFGKLLAFFFSFFGVILAIPLIVAIAVLAFKFDLRSFMTLHPLGSAVIAAGYAFIWVVAFFGLQDYFLVWKPAAHIAPIGKKELIDKLERSFKRDFDGKPLFDVFRSDDDRLAITWSQAISYFQVTAGGRIGKKRVVVLSFDEPGHEAFFLMKEKDWRWSLSAARFDFSLNYSAGIFAEISADVAPSVTFDKDGGFSIDLKKLSYDYRDLWVPIEKTLLSAGWTIRGGMLPGWGRRLAIAVPFAALVFVLFFLLLRSAPALPAHTPAKAPAKETAAADRDSYKRIEVEQIIASGKLKSAYQIEVSLAGLMKVPKDYFGDYEHAFIAYARVYQGKADKNPEFVARLDAFAKDYGVDPKTYTSPGK
ncbi:MAG: hypothetical protein EG826_13590 [Deltaproteobacteria bacterium]|nr:hypothetical protein [Deltaproteobacteria bacterium]